MHSLYHLYVSSLLFYLHCGVVYVPYIDVFSNLVLHVSTDVWDTNDYRSTIKLLVQNVPCVFSVPQGILCNTQIVKTQY